jgi:hypothetical protein
MFDVRICRRVVVSLKNPVTFLVSQAPIHALHADAKLRGPRPVPVQRGPPEEPSRGNSQDSKRRRMEMAADWRLAVHDYYSDASCHHHHRGDLFLCSEYWLGVSENGAQKQADSAPNLWIFDSRIQM